MFTLAAVVLLAAVLACSAPGLSGSSSGQVTGQPGSTDQAGGGSPGQPSGLEGAAGNAGGSSGGAAQPTATPIPTRTPIPVTATPIPPTSTPIPPTATRVPPTATRIPPTVTPVPPTPIPPTPVPPTAATEPPPPPPPPPPDYTVYDDQAAMLDLINQLRAGLASPAPPLSLNGKLYDAALAHAVDMVMNNFFDHVGSDGSLPWDRVSRAGYSWSSVRENIAAGYPTALDCFNGWVGSPGHYANMIATDVTEIGLAHVTRPGTTYYHYWVLVLARP
jgi:uncharacterized protein YkwD